MNSSLGPWLILLLSIGGLVLAFFVIRRQRYLKSLRDQGWTFDGSPTLDRSYGLNCPPFGIGYNRKIDDLISGTTSAGVPFAVFEYNSLGYVAALMLPRPLPELFVGTTPRPGAEGMQRTVGPWTMTAKDPSWAEAALAAIGAAMDAMAAGGHRVDLSVDGARLVALGVPREAQAMRAFLEALAPIAQALASPALAAFEAPAPPSELSLYQRPSWIYRPEDDRFLDQVTVTSSGYSHEARDVVVGDVHGIRMIAFTHHWKTDHTETSTDANGNTTTRTVTDNHSEEILEFLLPWHFGDLSVNWPGWGNRVRFESSDFDRAFKVRSRYPKFASDVFHPRQLEFMLSARPLPFAIESGRVRFDLGDNTPERIMHCADFLVAFFAGVPGFVWADLGHTEPPISRDLDGF
ncbi:MAG: hypothetical protein QM619_13560 [Micropruina sp.]|uniref:hypothetical protein n=1 Tax=Micropruina sp. TaxID=2737536 RepID=UPI0039E3C99B